jgi:AcrR family transcriptional regulator
MSRPPHARAAILAAAESIVKDIGAANLTFDELVRVSGITRGGITYHFPTKEALLQALVEHDLGEWNACVATKRASRDGPNADLAAWLESGTEPDPESARLCAGLLSASSRSKDLNRPWADHYAEHHRSVCRRSADPALATVLSLAADGLFWQEALGLSPLNAVERRAVVARLLAMAESMGAPAPPPARRRPPR